MRRLLALVLAAAIGYVLGARAGRRRYDQITALARRWFRGEADDTGAHRADEPVGGATDPSAWKGAVSTAANPAFDEPFVFPDER